MDKKTTVKERPYASEIRVLKEVHGNLTSQEKKFSQARKAIRTIHENNLVTRATLTQQELEDQKNQPKRLDFGADGEIKGDVEVKSARLKADCVSLADERELLKPFDNGLQQLQMEFQKFLDAPKSDRLSLIEKAATCLLSMADRFHLHRLFYKALSAANLARSLLKGYPKTQPLSLKCSTMYMQALRSLHMYGCGVSVYTETKPELMCSVTFPLECGLCVVESAWILLLTSQRIAGQAAHRCTTKTRSPCTVLSCPVTQQKELFSLLKQLASIIALSDNEEPETQHVKPLLEAHYFRLFAHTYLVHPETAFKTVGLPATTSPLFLLENAKNLVAGVMGSWGGSLSHQLSARNLYLTLLQDISLFMLRVGAPTEALPFANLGQAYAKRELSCRWYMVFASLIAQCRLAQNYLPEFTTAVQELKKVLSGRNPSILASLLDESADEPKSGNTTRQRGDIHDLAARTGEMALNARDGPPCSGESSVGLKPWDMLLKCLSHKPEDVCEECLDFDLHVSFLESVLLDCRSNIESKRKEELYRKSLADFEVLKLKGAAVMKLLKLEADSPSVITTAVMTKILLRNIAAGFTNYRPNTKAASISHGLAGVTLCLKSYGEFRVTHPEIIIQAQFLDALNLIVSDTASVKKLTDFIESRWSFSIKEAKSAKRGEIICDRLTEQFQGGTPRRQPRSAVPRPTTPESTPAVAVKPTKKDKPGQFDAKPPGKKSRPRIEKLGEGDIPEMTPTMLAELAEHAKQAESARLPVPEQSRANLREEDLRYLAETTFAQLPPDSVTDVSKNIRTGMTILEDSLRSMATFPLYPYQRMMSNLLVLLTGNKDKADERKVDRELAKLCASSYSGKFNHLSLMYYNRLLVTADPEKTTQIVERAQHFILGTKSVALNTRLLPRDWVVCSISCTTQLTLPVRGVGKPGKWKVFHFVITRWERGMEPVTMHVKVDDDLESYMVEEHISILESADDNQKYHKDTGDYWRTRQRLDQEMMFNIDNMQSLLGFAAVLLLAAPQTMTRELKSHMAKLREIGTRHDVTIADNVLQILCATSLVPLSQTQLLSLTSALLKQPEHSAVVVNVVAAVSKVVSQPSDKRSPLILLLDNDLWQLPWESIPCLRQQPVSRVPSVEFLNMKLADYQRQEALKHDMVYYIVNPGADLQKSEATFHGFLRRLQLEKLWHGVSGTSPSADEVKTAFSHELILYSGHGAGQPYFNVNAFDSHTTSAGMFLMGCSSVRLDSSVHMDGTGFFQSFLLMGSPCVVGNLWSVLCKWVDMFTEVLLENILNKQTSEKGSTARSDSGKCFSDMFSQSRKGGKLSRLCQDYLLGSAPVVIGLPVTY